MNDEEKSKAQLLVELKDLRQALALAQSTTAQTGKQLTEKQRQAHKMESIGILAGGIAHDFNNILGTILANTEVLCDMLQHDVKMLNYLDNITQCSLRGADLIKQILTYSRMRPIAVEAIDLAAEVNKSLKMIRSGLTSEVIVEQKLLPNCPMIRADKTQLNQILINLCSNAQHSFEGGKGKILVEVKLQSGVEGNQLLLMITDNGKGMSESEIEHVFDPFYTTKEVGAGTGLGLSVVHGIVESHGGTIKVDSHLGKGTCVCIGFNVIHH